MPARANSRLGSLAALVFGGLLFLPAQAAAAADDAAIGERDVAPSGNTPYQPPSANVTYERNEVAPAYPSPSVRSDALPNDIRTSESTDDKIQIEGAPVLEEIQPTKPPDERPMWRLYAQHQFEALRARVALLKSLNPKWTPSTELRGVLELIELQDALERAAQKRDWSTALTVRNEHPDRFQCGDINDLWMLADVARLTRQPEEEKRIYAQILATCTEEKDRLTTLERFATFGSPAEMRSLFAEEEGHALATQDRARLDALRARFEIGELGRLVYSDHLDGASVLAPRLLPQIVATKNADGAAALGWLEMKKGRPAAAIQLFQDAATWNQSPKHAADLALAYLAAGHADGAALIADRYRDSPALVSVRKSILLNQAQRAYEAKDYIQAIAIAERAADMRLVSPDLSLIRAWSLYQLGRPEAAEAFAALAIGAHDDQAAIGLLYSLTQQCPAPPAASVETPPVADACVAAAVDRNGRERTRRIVETLERHLLAGASDSSAASALAWFWARAGQPETAIGWFQRAQDWAGDAPARDNATAGLATVVLGAGRYDEARQLLEPRQASEAFRPLYADSLRGLARQADADKRYTDSLALLARVDAIDPGRPDDRIQAAWDDYKLGNYPAAGAAFQRLYQETPTQESAKGLVAVATVEGDLSPLAGLSGPIQPLLQQTYGDQAYAQHQFALAEALAPERFPQLGGISTPTARADILYRDKSGAVGGGRLSGPSVFSAADFATKSDQWTMGLAVDNWLTGSPGTALPVGSPGVARFAPDTRTGTVFEPQIGWHRPGPVEFSAALGTTPLGGRSAPTVTGEFGTTWHLPDGRNTLGLSRQSNRESVLSFSGERDPVTGATWGRVVETSLHGDTYQPLGNDWGLSAGASLGELDGIHVERNEAAKATLSVGKNLAPSLDWSKLAYVTVGPQYQLDAFRRNLGNFTFGQGGYYSPQSFQQFGAGLNFETAPTGSFVAHGDASLGWQIARQAASNEFPLTGGTLAFPAQRQSSLGGSGFADLSYKLGPRLLLDAGVSYAANPNYREMRVLVGIHIPLGGARASTVVSDLADFMFK